MEEIALVISSLAGACTAVALDKLPKQKYNKQPISVNSAIKNQLNSLRVEKEILAKTITRLYHEESNISKVQRDKLLIRYQHQLGTAIAKIEKLETAAKYPDLGPIGDSLISLMDNKLTKLDQRLHEISSKMSITSVQQVPVVNKIQEEPKQIVQERPKVERVEIKPDTSKGKIEIQTEVQTLPIPIEIPLPEKRVSVELSTLTAITNKIPEFPPEFIKSSQYHIEIEDKKDSINFPEPLPATTSIEVAPLIQKQEPVIELPKVENAEPIEKKIQLPSPIKIPEEEKIEDDDKDLDKIKSEIMKALSKLEQVEVE